MSRGAQTSMVAEIIRFINGPEGAIDAATMAAAAAIEKSAYVAACNQCAARGVNTFESEVFQCAYNHSLFNLRQKLDPAAPRPNTNLHRMIRQCILAYRYIEPPLLQEVLDEIFPLAIIASMHPEQLNPELYADQIEEYSQRKNVSFDIVYCTHYLCTCGARKTIVTRAQLRSADEGGTDLIHCIACNRRWKKTG